ncbi:MAG TPA: hypothetical protein VI874_02365, partial [Candidatus Norongarragalinales archaeon]|nr:hypothetical protein [Candidatus Norongarragalinales archaeon]
MPRSKKVLDENRIRILSELFSKGTLRPNFSLLSERTGLSRPTLASSIQYLINTNALSSFQPSLNWRAMGFKIEALELANLDLSERKTLDELIALARSDVHCRLFASLVSGDYNVALRDMYRTVEDLHTGLNQTYYARLPALYDAIRKRSFYYFSDPVYKHQLMSRAVSALSSNHPAYETKSMQHDDTL